MIHSTISMLMFVFLAALALAAALSELSTKADNSFSKEQRTGGERSSPVYFVCKGARCTVIIITSAYKEGVI